MTSIEERVERLLNQLENPGLRPWEIEAIQGKIEFLNSLDK